MILKIFSPKNSAKKLSFLNQNKAKLCKILIITLVFEKNANFFAKNCQKSQKIVIITSTQDQHPETGFQCQEFLKYFLRKNLIKNWRFLRTYNLQPAMLSMNLSQSWNFFLVSD
jgi:hypothetical protein